MELSPYKESNHSRMESASSMAHQNIIHAEEDETKN
jgi:hypothetical protein